METKLSPKMTISDIYELMARDLPILWKLNPKDYKITENFLENDSQIYLDLLSKAFVVFDINAEDFSETQQLIKICDKLMILSEKYELKRINQSMDKLLKELQTNVNSLEKKSNESILQMKNQSSFESVMTEKIRFYSMKSKEYYNSLKTKENFLAKNGFTSDLKKESIDEIKDKNQEMKNRLNDINARLNEYKEFNPTESQLKNKISEMKAEIKDLDALFNK